MITGKLYLEPENGKLKGVCAGLATYLDIPVTLVRVMVVLSLFCGLFIFTVIAYTVLACVLKPCPVQRQHAEQTVSAAEMLVQLRRDLQAGEAQLRNIERYITSETFSVRSRFRRQHID
ncbi:envelope stress response membrane protein PspC [Enterobacteriaceae bacterium LUAb1]